MGDVGPHGPLVVKNRRGMNTPVHPLAYSPHISDLAVARKYNKYIKVPRQPKSYSRQPLTPREKLHIAKRIPLIRPESAPPVAARSYLEPPPTEERYVQQKLNERTNSVSRFPCEETGCVYKHPGEHQRQRAIRKEMQQQEQKAMKKSKARQKQFMNAAWAGYPGSVANTVETSHATHAEASGNIMLKGAFGIDILSSNFQRKLNGNWLDVWKSILKTEKYASLHLGSALSEEEAWQFAYLASFKRHEAIHTVSVYAACSKHNRDIFLRNGCFRLLLDYIRNGTNSFVKVPIRLKLTAQSIKGAGAYEQDWQIIGYACLAMGNMAQDQEKALALLEVMPFEEMFNFIASGSNNSRVYALHMTLNVAAHARHKWTVRQSQGLIWNLRRSLKQFLNEDFARLLVRAIQMIFLYTPSEKAHLLENEWQEFSVDVLTALDKEVDRCDDELMEGVFFLATRGLCRTAKMKGIIVRSVLRILGNDRMQQWGRIMRLVFDMVVTDLDVYCKLFRDEGGVKIISYKAHTIQSKLPKAQLSALLRLILPPEEKLEDHLDAPIIIMLQALMAEHHRPRLAFYATVALTGDLLKKWQASFLDDMNVMTENVFLPAPWLDYQKLYISKGSSALRQDSAIKIQSCARGMMGRLRAARWREMASGQEFIKRSGNDKWKVYYYGKNAVEASEAAGNSPHRQRVPHAQHCKCLACTVHRTPGSSK